MASEVNLKDLFVKYGHLDNCFGTDKELRHKYSHAYETWFHGYKDSPISLIEVGVFSGYSMLAWREYFSKADLYGVDNVDVLAVIPIGWQFILGDATKVETFPDMDFDIVVDDGSHLINDMIITAQILMPRTRCLYIIEDIPGNEALQQLSNTLGQPAEVFDNRAIARGEYNDDIVAAWFMS